MSEFDVVETCTGTYDTANSNYIVSPNYPSNYDDASDCKWNIKTLNSRTIALHFTYFLTEQVDRLMVYNGSNVDRKHLTTISGGSYPPVIFPTGKTTFLRFKTSVANNNKGFRILLKTYGKYTGQSVSE